MLHKLFGLHIPMPARDHRQVHRAATTLELFYDLVIVISIAFAASNLHHAIAENHIAHGVLTFVMVFWAIWWAWMSFTWFASSYDSDDIPYRLAIFAQLIGSLILAAGIDNVFENNDFKMATLGYILMRLALVALWVRVIKSNPQDKSGALRYAFGIGVCQIGWVILVFFMPKDYLLMGFGFLLVCEHFVPFYADLKKQSRWHRRHIIERYGLLTIIVLGEALLASTHAMKSLSEHYEQLLLSALIGGLLILFCMWWLYFNEEEHPNLQYSTRAFLWGYGHYMIFAAITAVGAGLEVVTDQINEHAQVSLQVANAAVAIPSAVFLFAMWFVHDLHHQRTLFAKILFPISASFILITPLVTHGILVIGVLLLITLVIRLNATINGGQIAADTDS